MGDFVHLHNHTHYSLQDAACTVDSLIDAAVENNQHALALTDHGVMYGVSEFYKKAKKKGIKPIIGSEVYIVVNGSRFEKGEKSGGRKKSKHYNHLVLLAKNDKGYKNLCKLVSIGFTEGFYYKPRIDMEVLEKYKEGLIALSACLGGVVSAPILEGDLERAKNVALKFKNLFGDDFYLEVQDHGLEKDKAILENMPKLSKELGIKLIATNDIHYIKQEHSIAHNILLMLSDKTGNYNYRELRYGTDQIYFKSTEEMKELFKDLPEAISNTLDVESKIDDNISFGGLHFPEFPIPKDSPAKTLEEYFELLAKEGLEKRFKGKEITQEVWDRFNYEVKVINDMGYPGYFLITQDFINAAKNMGIPVGPGRGSAAGSLVAYALRITNVNPLDYDLLFERFLNPARQSMPDIDIDFADDQRSEVIDYVKEKYGENSVCQIVTFNTLSSKAVLTDVARVLGIPIPTVKSITKHIPVKFGKNYSIAKSLDEVPELKWVRESKDPQIKDLIKYSQVLEGMNRNNSKHAAGVVIAPSEVSNYVALATAGASKDLVTQFNMKELEGSAGLLKMDFLGLRTLTIIRDAINLVKKTRNIDIDLDKIPLDDKKTYELFGKGQTTAVFQFESPPMKEHLKNLKPSSIKDLAAMNALYRPGPMDFISDFINRKHGKAKATYLHPILEPILKETYGIIVYQEQVIQLANKVAGMSLAEADILRRAMGKKDLKAMAEQRAKFIKGAVENNIPKKIAEEVFAAIDKFANYGFNKSHAVAYSIVAYQTAYLKANFLPEFLAANLTNEFGNTDKVTILLDDCRKLKVPVALPDVNNPSVKFTVVDGKIVFGMSAIKNVGISAVEEIEKARSELGRDFKSIYDFTSHVDTRTVNKRAMEGLVLSGAFDTVKGTRAQNFAAIEHALSFGGKVQAASINQAESLFGNVKHEIEIEEPELPDVDEWTLKEQLAKEREVLGFYLSDHPLRKFESEYNSFSTIRLGDPSTFGKSDYVRACGVVTSVKTKIDRSGRTMAFFRLDDFTGSCDCIMFGKSFAEYGNLITPESTILLMGKLESSGDSIQLQAEEVIELSIAAEKLTKSIGLLIDGKKHDENTITNLKNIFSSNDGEIPVFIVVINNGERRKFLIDFKVKMSKKLVADIQQLLGEGAVAYQTI